MIKLFYLVLFSLIALLPCEANQKTANDDQTEITSKALKVMTFNIWQEGTMVENGLDKIRDVILETNPDIVCFTEVRNYNKEDWTQKIVKKLKDAGVDYFGKFAGGDVSLISKYPIGASKVVFSAEGSVVSFNVEFKKRDIMVFAAHLDYTYYACYLPRGYNGGTPNWGAIIDSNNNIAPVTNVDKILEYHYKSTRDEQIDAFLKAVENETKPVILMGDFNEPSHLDWTQKTAHYFDHNGVVVNWPTTHSLFKNGFIDAYREFYPDELKHPGITWPSLAHGKETTSWTPLADERDRIDFIFYKGKNITTTAAALVGPKESYVRNNLDTSHTAHDKFLAHNLRWPSDHKAVMVTLKFN